MMYVVLHNDFILEIAQIGRDLHEKKLLGIISFCVNNSIAVDRIRILRSNKVYFFDNYISSNCFIGNIIAEIVKVSSKENTALHNQILL